MINSPLTDRSGVDQGFALLAVLGFLLLISLFLAAFAASARLSLLTANNNDVHARLSYAADAITSYIAWRLGSDRDLRRESDLGRKGFEVCRIDQTLIALSILPHGRLTNVNTADDALLASTLDDAGLADADQAARAIVQFRSAERDPGAGDSDVAGGMRRAPLEDVAELHDIGVLRHLSLRTLNRLFSVQEGRSMKQNDSQTASSSSFYTIQATLFGAGGWGEQGAIFQVGEGGRTKRIANLAFDDPPQRPADGSTCAFLGAPVAQAIAEALR